MPLGGPRDHPEFWTARANCAACGMTIQTLEALCCANLFENRGHFPKCMGIWCHGCYKEDTAVEFPVRRADDDPLVGSTTADESRFTFGRAGDQFVTRFQCDCCHFQNIKGHIPSDSIGADQRLLTFIRRANLDAMWSQEVSTIEMSRREIKRACKTFASFGISWENVFFQNWAPHP
jgi:hypothetical protein